MDDLSPSQHKPARAGARDSSEGLQRLLRFLRLLMLQFGALAAVLLGGGLGLLTAPSSTGLALFWAPAAVLLVGLIRFGVRLAPGLWLGLLALTLLQGLPAALGLALASAQLAAMAAAQQVLRLSGFHGRQLETRQDLLRLCLAGIVGTGLSAALCSAALQTLAPPTMAGATAEFWPLFALQCLAQGCALLALSPGLLSLSGGPGFLRLRPADDEDAEAASGSSAGRPNADSAPRPFGTSPRWRQAAAQIALLVLGLSAVAALWLHGGWAQPHQLILPLLLLSALALQTPAPALLLGMPALLLGLAWLSGQQQGPFAAALAGGEPGLAAGSPGLAAVSGIAQLGVYSLLCTLLPSLIHLLARESQHERQHWQDLLGATSMGVAEWQLGRKPGPLRRVRVGGKTSPAWRRYTGSQPGAGAWPSDWLNAAHAMDRERCRDAIEAQLLPGGPEHVREELRLKGRDGAWQWFELQGRVQERDAQGHALRLLTLLRDTDWQHTAEERQRMSAALFQHLHEGLAVTDTDYRLLDANPSFCRMLGQTREALQGQIALPLHTLTLRHSGLDPELLQQSLLNEGFWQARVQLPRPEGGHSQLQLTVSGIPEPSGPQRYRVVTMSDLTQSLRQEERLERQSRYDELTGLPNHEEFMRLLDEGLAASEREGFRLSVCRLDLDHFKRINDRHGREQADRLLRELAARLQASLRGGAQWSDVVARLSGDEFALLLRSKGPEEAQQALERLLAVVAQPYRIETGPDQVHTVTLSASMGATLFPQDDSDAETLLRHAGHALYRVKHGGRNGFQLFDTAKRLRNEASLIAMARVQQALDAAELRLYFQPKIDMRTGQVLGMEALLRWQHPERGLLSPVHFLPLIEPTGLGVQVGDWVIEQALKHSEQWLQEGLQLHISVNVTARQLQTADFAQRLLELIRRHGGPVARHLSLEVLESAALADIAATQALITRCRSFGVSFALDDFGTGYSNLSYLQRLPVDALKIDRSFVQNMLINGQDSALVEGVIGLARNFGCAVIAEGVETAAHARALLRLGCSQGQGNGIAAAMPAGDVADWVRQFPQSGWMQSLRAREPSSSASL